MPPAEGPSNITGGGYRGRSHPSKPRLPTKPAGWIAKGKLRANSASKLAGRGAVISHRTPKRLVPAARSLSCASRRLMRSSPTRSNADCAPPKTYLLSLPNPRGVEKAALPPPHHPQGAGQAELPRLNEGDRGEPGRQRQHPRWTSYGALEVDVFTASAQDFQVFLAAIEPLSKVEIFKNLDEVPPFKPRRNSERGYWPLQLREVLGVPRDPRVGLAPREGRRKETGPGDHIGLRRFGA